MIRRLVLALLCGVLAVAGSGGAAGAQDEAPPRQLWDELPLEPSATPDPAASAPSATPQVVVRERSDGMSAVALIALVFAAGAVGGLTARLASRGRSPRATAAEPPAPAEPATAGERKPAAKRAAAAKRPATAKRTSASQQPSRTKQPRAAKPQRRVKPDRDSPRQSDKPQRGGKSPAGEPQPAPTPPRTDEPQQADATPPRADKRARASKSPPPTKRPAPPKPPAPRREHPPAARREHPAGPPRHRRFEPTRAHGPAAPETCVIELRQADGRGQFCAVAREPRTLLACSPPFALDKEKPPRGITPPQALAALVEELRAAGWRQSAKGPRPWDLLFRRQVPAGRPARR